MEQQYLKASLDAARTSQHDELKEPEEPEKVFHVCKHVYLGTKSGAADLQMLHALNISAVINLSAGVTRIPCYFQDQFEYLHLELTDEQNSNLGAAAPSAIKAIDSWGAEGKRVMVHCRAGLSRSATVVIAWLMVSQRMSLKDATHLVLERRGRRPKCNVSFWCYLAALERELRGWPCGTEPSFDFTDWLVRDWSAMGMPCSESQITEALHNSADWTNFSLFYTALSGWGFKKLMVAQGISQKRELDIKLARKAVVPVLETMTVFHSWAACLVYCLQIVEGLLSNCPKLRRWMISDGGLHATTQAMREHLEDLSVQRAACRVLYHSVAKNESNVLELEILGGVEDVVRAMQAHPSHADLQCLALGILVSMVTAAQRETPHQRYQQEAVIRTVVSAMQAHNAAKVQDTARKFLGMLVVKPDKQTRIPMQQTLKGYPAPPSPNYNATMLLHGQEGKCNGA